MDYFLQGNPNPNPNSCESSSVGKKKRGSKVVKLSTDPQSVAARERRHRISERFKILQSLVPGGTKMDTVSMLEEAINYVKFLKAQIWLHHHHTMLNHFNPNSNFIPPDFLPNSHQLSLSSSSQNNLVDPMQSSSAQLALMDSCFQDGETMPNFDAHIKY